MLLITETENEGTDLLVDDPDELLAPEEAREERERQRSSKRPPIDHLEDAFVAGEAPAPAFNPGDYIVVEFHCSPLGDGRRVWMGTKVLRVDRIGDERGRCLAHCTDEETGHYNPVLFPSELSRAKLAPRDGSDPFKVPKQKRHAAPVEQGEKRGRGRPKGSKNRPKEEIKAERLARKAERDAKEAGRKRRRG